MMKTVNAEASGSHGAARDAMLRVDSWPGNVDFLVVTLDDFEVILGNEFLRKAKVLVMPHFRGILIGDEQSPCFVKSLPIDKKEKGLFLSAMQANKGAQKGEPTLAVVLVDTKPKQTINVLDRVVAVLEESKDIMPPELPKWLPPRRVVDHVIELEPGARPSSQAPCRMLPLELAKLRKQLNELLEASFGYQS